MDVTGNSWEMPILRLRLPSVLHQELWVWQSVFDKPFRDSDTYRCVLISYVMIPFETTSSIWSTDSLIQQVLLRVCSVSGAGNEMTDAERAPAAWTLHFGDVAGSPLLPRSCCSRKAQMPLPACRPSEQADLDRPLQQFPLFQARHCSGAQGTAKLTPFTVSARGTNPHPSAWIDPFILF